MSLQATFNLTPRESYHYVGLNQYAKLSNIYGAVFFPKNYSGQLRCFDEQHANDMLYFRYDHAADPTLDYSTLMNRKLAPRIELTYDLSALGAAKEMALLFSFQTYGYSPRLLIFTNAGLLGDETLADGDNQFLLEIESLDYFSLYFIHARQNGSSNGGSFFFKGITGYVV